MGIFDLFVRFVGENRFSGFVRRFQFGEQPEVPLRVDAGVGAHEDAERRRGAVEVDVRKGDVHVVGFPEVQCGVVDMPVRLRVAEAGAETEVVLDEIAERGVDREDAPAEIQVVEDQHVVGVVAGDRPVRDGQPDGHFPLEYETDTVDLAVDPPARGQEAFPVGGGACRVAGRCMSEGERVRELAGKKRAAARQQRIHDRRVYRGGPVSGEIARKDRGVGRGGLRCIGL